MSLIKEMSSSSKTIKYPLFIVFEGIECSGKTTNLKLLEEYLKISKINFITTREPGGTKEGEKIRDILLTEDITREAELLLLFASRSQHIKNVIIPALNKGKIVICDRFTDSSYAYQGGGRKIESHYIESLENLVQGSLRPDLTIIFDVPVSISMERLKARKELSDRIEKEKINFFNRARDIYLKKGELNPEKYRIIDATKPINEVQEDLRKQILDFFKN